MKEAQKAASDLRLFVSKLKPLFDLAIYLDDIGSIEQAKRDAETKKIFAEKEYESVKKELDKSKSELEKSRNEILISESGARNILNSAKQKAKEILESCNSDCESKKFELSLREKKAHELIESKHKESNELDKEIKLKRLELSEISDKVEELKNKLKSFMG